MLTAPPGDSRRRWIGVWIAYWCFAFILTHLPPRAAGSLPFPGADKLVHFALYSVLAWMGGRALTAAGARLNLKSALIWFFWLAVYGAVDEWTQQFVGRTPSLFDWFADVAGVALGLGVHLALGDRRKRPQSHAAPGPRTL